MTSHPRISPLLFGSFALAVAVFSYVSFRSVETTKPSNPMEAASTPPAGPVEKTRETGTAVAAKPVPRAPGAAENPSTPPALAGSVEQLLPGIRQPVTNWKEFKPGKITIAPYPDLPVEFEMTSISEEHGRTVWIGRNPNLQGAFLIAAATENDWHATLAVPAAGTFDIHIAGQSVAMLEKSRIEACGTPLAAERPDATADRAGQELFEAPVAAAADSLTTVDVLAFYDDAALALTGTVANFETRMIAQIGASNLALENSAVPSFRWRYLASYQVPAYTATNDMTDDLYMITGRKEAGAAFPNPVNDFVTQKAVLHGADQVCFLSEQRVTTAASRGPPISARCCRWRIARPW